MSEDEDEDNREPRGDPFEQLGRDVADREGDPFEQLDSERETDQQDNRGDAADPLGGPGSDERPAPTDPETEWFEKPDLGPERDTGTETGPTGEPDESEQSASSAVDSTDVRSDIGRRDPGGRDPSDPLGDVSPRDGDPFEDMGNAFEEAGSGTVDPDTVWQDLTSAESRGSVGDTQERTYADVSKHSYCEQCKHFSGPPKITCNHEGTEIVEFLDMETVRLVDCPVVAERRELQQSGSSTRE